MILKEGSSLWFFVESFLQNDLYLEVFCQHKLTEKKFFVLLSFNHRWRVKRPKFCSAAFIKKHSLFKPLSLLVSVFLQADWFPIADGSCFFKTKYTVKKLTNDKYCVLFNIIALQS